MSLTIKDEMKNDHKLIKKFQKGDKSAFDRLVRKYLHITVGFFNKWKNLLHLDQIINQQKKDTSVAKEWLNKELWDAISKLPKKQRSVVVMRVAKELSYKEISAITGMSENTAKVNFHHALQTLKEVLNND